MTGATAITGPVIRPKRAIVGDLFPGYFALVMATGIVSLAAYAHGLLGLAKALFLLNISAYALLWVLTLARIFRYRDRFFADLTSHKRGVGFLTIAAATNVLGSQAALIEGWTSAGIALWFVAGILWVVLLYAFMTAVTVRGDKPSLGEGIGGAWLLLVVSTESIAVLGAQMAPAYQHPRAMLLVSAMAHFIGAMLYVVLIGLIFYRWTFFAMKAEDVTPPYWINMGALAITTLAGANLLNAPEIWPYLTGIETFLEATTVLFWSFATWWIPLLVIIGAWRHFVRGVSLRYDPQYWSLVFPLGMYSVATSRVEEITQLTPLGAVSAVFFWVSLAAWAVTFVAMLWSFRLSPAEV